MPAHLRIHLYRKWPATTQDYIERKWLGGYVSCMSTWHKSDPEYNPQLFGTLFRDLVIFPITLIQLEHLSVMAAYVVIHIRLVNIGLQTAYAREIPVRVKGNRQYRRSFVYCRKLACSTVSYPQLHNQPLWTQPNTNWLPTWIWET